MKQVVEFLDYHLPIANFFLVIEPMLTSTPKPADRLNTHNPAQDNPVLWAPNKYVREGWVERPQADCISIYSSLLAMISKNSVFTAN